MLRDITIGQFFPGNSVVHKMDPRMKLALTVLYITIIFICKNIISLGIIVLTTVLLTLLSKISFKMIIKSIKPILPILLFTAILNIFLIKGTVIASFWIFQITREGVENMVFLTIRIVCLIISGSMLTYTTSPTSLTDAIERLLSPLKIFKIDVNSIAMMMTISLRFIPILIDEVEKIMNAQKARGADIGGGNILQRVRSMLPIFIPLFVSSFRRAYELAFAMECRCYRGGKGRTRMKEMKLRRRDYVALACMALLLAVIIFSNRYFNIFVLKPV